MEKIDEVTSLIDNYANLLSDKKQVYIEQYYFNDLSLQEIANIYNVSRSAIHEAIQDAIKELQSFENKLKFLNKRKARIAFVTKHLKDDALIQEYLNLEYGKK